jgi:hypothetical protein
MESQRTYAAMTPCTLRDSILQLRQVGSRANEGVGHTGTSDIPLTANGEKRMRATGRAMIGKDRLIVPEKIAHMCVCVASRAPARSPVYPAPVTAHCRLVQLSLGHADPFGKK